MQIYHIEISQEQLTNLTIKSSNQEIKKVKFLGIIIDHHLAWKSHIEHIATKMSKTLGIPCRFCFYVNQF